MPLIFTVLSEDQGFIPYRAPEAPLEATGRLDYTSPAPSAFGNALGQALAATSANEPRQLAQLDDGWAFSRDVAQRSERYAWLTPRTDAPVYEDFTGGVLAKSAYSGDLIYGADGTPGLYASMVDKALISDAQSRIQNLRLNPIYDRSDPNQYLIVVSADGTRNDGSQPIPTNPYELRRLALGVSENVRTIYAKGIGTEWDFGGVNSALGLGQDSQISEAHRDIIQTVNDIYESNSEAKFVFVTTGFSRGAASIRSLHNLLVESGIPDRSSALENGEGNDKRIEFGRNIIEPGKINIGASVLFDTVNTGMGRLHDLSIPAQVGNVLHLTARDEARTFFPLVSALDPIRSNSERILELTLPGAHTNIGGGSYDIGGIGHMNLQLAYTYLDKLGVPLAPFPAKFTPRPDRFVIHDSRWVKDQPFSELLNQGIQRNVNHVRNR